MDGKLSADLALRIGVAARCLPGESLGNFVTALIAAVGLPLDSRKLQQLNADALRRAGRDILLRHSRKQFNQCLLYLSGRKSIRIIDAAADDEPQAFAHSAPEPAHGSGHQA